MVELEKKHHIQKLPVYTMKKLIFAPLIFLSLLVNAQEVEFITNSRLILGGEKEKSASISAGDIDQDGDIDVVVADGRHWPQTNKVFYNNGYGIFTVSRFQTKGTS